MSASSIARAAAQAAPGASADGPIVGQGSCCGVRPTPPSHGRADDALRPALTDLDAELGGADALAVRDDSAERVFGGVRIDAGAAMRDAADALDTGRLHDTSDAPEFASMPRCVVCQGLGTPSSALY